MFERTPPVCIVWAAAAIAAAAVSPMALAADYMTVAEAQRLMFPDATAFLSRAVSLQPEQAARLTARLGKPVSMASWSVTAAMSGDALLGFVVADSVTGKFEQIRYAVGLAPNGEIRDVEILAYREAHGGEVRSKAWRAQFVGKTASSSPLTLGDDIANISGATLSCTHLTDGVRRIAAYVQVALAKP